MRGWVPYFTLELFSVVFITLCVSFNVAYAEVLFSANDSVETKKNIGLYHDRQKNIYYDIAAVCDFAAPFISEPQKFILQEEWQDIKLGKYNKSYPIDDPMIEAKAWFVYTHDGIEVVYFKGTVPTIWQITFEADRLPISMRNKSYFNNIFVISPMNTVTNTMALNCDNYSLKIEFDGDVTKSLEVELSPNSI